jgi:hypothetical protein
MAHHDGGTLVALLFAIGAVALLMAWLIHELRSDRATAIETFAIMIILIGCAAAADTYMGKDYRLLAFGPPVIWFAVRWFMSRPRNGARG